MATELEKITWIDNGLLDVSKIIRNLETIRDAVDEVERLRVNDQDNAGQMYPTSTQYAIESYGDHQILDKAIRAEMQLKQAFVVAGGADAQNEGDMHIELLKNGTDPLLETSIVIKSSENTGKMKMGTLVDYQHITQFDTITAHTGTNRKVVVTLVFEAVN